MNHLKPLPSFGNYPPGVTGNEDHLTGRYHCEKCEKRVSEGEHYVESDDGKVSFAVCSSCEDELSICDSCAGLCYTEELTKRADPDDGTVSLLICPDCTD